MTTPKVSVVVATYRSGRGLDRLVASLDAQTLPSDEWEAIFVDDGSPDDTWDRLQEIKASRPHFRLERIENSGWPCRPRNIGTDLARGEYVAYMDHDDELYPDALRDGYAFAKLHGSDVVNGKEARTNDIGWAAELYLADEGQVRDRTDVHPLIPTNPHKLYRREFLNEHGIRFREGGRVLWEDVFFNVLVGRHAQVISTMSSTPYYHWFATPGSGSSSFLRSRSEWWYWLEQIVSAISTDLSGDELVVQRRLLLEHQYRSRLLDSFNNRFAPRPAAERKLIFEHARRIQAEYFPEEFDAHLNRTLRMRAQLLRRGYAHLLERLTVDDPNIPGRPEITGAEWHDGVLKVTARGDWIDNGGRRHRFTIRDGRFIKNLDPRYRDEFDDELLDMTDDLAEASLSIGVRSTDSRITWMAESSSTTWLDPDPSEPQWGVDAEARIDPRTAAMGNPLSRGVWELNGRCKLAGTVNHLLARSTALRPAILLDEGVAAVYARRDGVVVLDFDQTETPLTHLVRAVGVRSSGDRIIVDVVGVPTDGDVVIPTSIDMDTRPIRGLLRTAALRTTRSLLRRKAAKPYLWERRPATLRIVGGRATIEFDRPSAPVSFAIGQRVPGGSQVYRFSSARGAVTAEHSSLAGLR